RLAALGVGIKLRRLAPVKAAILAHDANAAMAQLFDPLDFPGRPAACRLRILPSDQERELSRIVDAVVDVMVNDAAVLQVYSEMSGQQIGLACESRILVRRYLGEGCNLRRADLGLIETQLPDRRLPGRIGVEGRLADAQAIILENVETSLFLHEVVLAF